MAVGCHSDCSLLLILKCLTKQKKRCAFLQYALLQHWEHHKEEEEAEPNQRLPPPARSEDAQTQYQDYHWDAMLVDTSHPLVVDIGCGMEGSLFELASCGNNNTTAWASLDHFLGEDSFISSLDHNFVGVNGDLGTRYGWGYPSLCP